MRLLPLLLLSACKADPAPQDGQATGVPAIWDASRGEHYFDVPFPRSELLDEDGFPDLTGFPTTEAGIAGPVVDGWARRLELTANGFGNNTAAYFRFEGPLELPTTTNGSLEDPVLLVDLATSELIPLELRFIEDPAGDPFYAANTLALAPALGHPPASGASLAAVVMRSAGAESPEGYTLPSEVSEALDVAGVSGEVAVATAFTIQDVTGQLQALAADVDARVDADFFADVQLARVAGLEIRQTTTESGEDTTAVTTVFEDGERRTAYAYFLDDEEEGSHDVDFGDEWPLAIYEGEIPILNYSGLEGAPYMSPGFTHITDTDEYTGWIDFAGGELLSEPDVEWMRITVGLPKDADGEPMGEVPVVIYDHGTAGQAYNAHQRVKKSDRGDEIAARFADAGWGLIGRDAALYGTRYPLIDEGYSGGSLGFYNIVNPPAFRDNQRQTAIEGHTLRRFLELGLNDALPAGTVDPTKVRRMGHSMGSVTTNLGAVAAPEDTSEVYLSGTGGVFILYFLETGLLGGFDEATLASLFTLFGADMPEEVTTEALLGAALELPEEAWPNLDRLHPVSTLFQWTMDPSDPMAVARDQSASSYILRGVGDYQVPNFTTDALAEALPDATVVDCEADGDYDPHSCLYRTQTGWDSVSDWLAE